MMFGIELSKLNPFAKTGTNLVGIDLSADNLKIAVLNIYGPRKEITRILARNIKGLSDDDITKRLQEAIQELKINKARVVLTIPAHLVITKNIEVPSVDQREIREIINLQAGRHTPYSREEINVDYLAIGTYKQNYTKILLLIVTSNVIKKQLGIIDKAGLKVEKVLFSQEGIAALSPRIFKAEYEFSPLSIIHIDESLTDFMIVTANKAIFVRSIPIGRQHLILEPEKFQVKFCEEIKKSVEAYQAENIERNPNILILTGVLDELQDLGAVLNEALHLAVRQIPYYQNISLSGEVSKSLRQEKEHSFLNLIAPLLTLSELKVDLVPEEIKLKKVFEQRSKDLIKTGILSLSLLVLVFILLISRIYFKTAYLRGLDARYKPLEAEAKKLENAFQKIIAIRNNLAGRGYSLQVLNELYEIIPLNLQLNDIRFDKEGKFTLKGTADSMATVFSFVDNLGKSKYFREVKTKYTTKRQEGKKDVTDFEVNCLINRVLDD